MAPGDLAAVQTAIVRPGDTLIVRVPMSCRPADAAQVTKLFKEKLPDVSIMLIAAEEMVVFRPEGAE